MTEEKKKSGWRKGLKWFLRSLLVVVLLLFVAIAIALNFVFTPSRLTPMVERLAADYLNADVKVGDIELTFFSTFPNFGVKMGETSVLSRKFRDSTQVAAKTDSLLYVKHCKLTVNPIAYLRKNRIVVREMSLDEPRIYAYVDADGRASWDILQLPADTTSVVEAEADTLDETFDGSIRLKGVHINKGKVVFDDRNTRLYASMDDVSLTMDGALGKRRSRLNLDFSADDILFWQEGNLLVNRLHFGVQTAVKIRRDSSLCRLEKTVFDVNGVRFGAGGTLRGDSINHRVAVDLKYGIHIPSLASLIEMVPEAVLQKDRKADIRGDVLCTGAVNGWYGEKNIPLVTAQFKIKDGYIAYEGMPSKIEELNTNLYARVDLEKKTPSMVRLDTFCIRGGKTDIDLSGEVDNLLGDPMVKAKLEASVDFDDLTQIFPLTDGVTCTGKIGASLKTKVLISDLTHGDYGRIKVGGWCKMNDVALFVPKDSIVLNLHSAGVGFATNRKNADVLQGVDLLDGVVWYSGMDVHIRNRLHVLMDTTYVTLKTTPLRDTATIATVNGGVHVGRTLVVVRDTLLLGVKRMDAKGGVRPSKRDKSVPRLEGDFQVDSLRLRALNNRLNVNYADVHIEASRSRRDTNVWWPKGYVDFKGLRAYTPLFPLRLRMPGTRIHFDRKEVVLDSAVLKMGKSDMRLTGSITNLRKAFFKKEDLIAELTVESDMINCNQIMRAFDMGTAYAEKVKAGLAERISNEEEDIDKMDVVSDTANYEGASSVFVVPKGVNFVFKTDLRKVLFGNLVMEDIYGQMVMKNQCIQVNDLNMSSSAADIEATMIYKASDTTKAYTGFDVRMHDIRIDSLVHVLPSLDTIFPMLRSFEGEVDFRIAAETWLDSTMMVDLPTLRAGAYLDGHNLVLMDGETFAEISKMLMFKNKKRNMIDTISVDMTIKDGEVEIYPFLLEMDRYKVAIGGKHNLDMSFKYHISLLKSILPFRAGVDISGTLEKMKFRITKAKYKDLFIPSRRAKLDTTQLNLRNKMHEMLREGSRMETVDTL